LKHIDFKILVYIAAKVINIAVGRDEHVDAEHTDAKDYS
jgi:hypothetical protein